MLVADAGSLAAVIRSRRKELDLTQQDLAELAGVSLRAVTLLESGSVGPSFRNLLPILSVLGLSLNLEVRAVGD